MSGVTAEIAADFIVEAQEILDRLGEQLVALEHAPDDRDQLNAVFRGFHTLKGGAGFLGITPMVELCHAAEVEPALPPDANPADGTEPPATGPAPVPEPQRDEPTPP